MGTCRTSAASRDKIGTISSSTIPSTNWSPDPGQVISVKFDQLNTVSNPRINANGHGAKSIYYDGKVYSSGINWVGGSAGCYSYYIWDGTYWVWLGQDHFEIPDHTHAELLNINQDVKTTASPVFANLTVSGEITAEKVYGAVYM